MPLCFREIDFVMEAVGKSTGKQEVISIEIDRLLYFPFERELSQKPLRSYTLPVISTVKYQTLIY